MESLIMESLIMLNLLANMLITSVMSVMFSLFIKFCLRTGMSLGWYKDMLHAILRASTRYIVLYNLLNYIFKPIGLCIYCFGTWISLIIYINLNGYNTDTLGLIELAWFLGINFTLLAGFNQLYNLIFKEQ